MTSNDETDTFTFLLCPLFGRYIGVARGEWI